jgi:hypothetical protein
MGFAVSIYNNSIIEGGRGLSEKKSLEYCPVCHQQEMWTAIHPNGDEIDYCNCCGFKGVRLNIER